MTTPVDQFGHGETAMKKFTAFVSLIIFTLCFSAYSFPVEPKGHLFIIGGGDCPESMMKKFIDLAHTFQSGKIIVFPMASGVPDKVGPEQVAELSSYGARSVAYHILSREQALDPESVNLLEGVGGVFFSGGVQSRLADVLNGTPILTKLHELYEKGGIIGGTSAGAAVIDQHFVRRKRHNRLISLVLENPNTTGIGIDESTAIIVYPGQIFEVIGQNNVIVYDASHADVDIQSFQPVSGHNLSMHILKPGDRFDIKTKTVNR